MSRARLLALLIGVSGVGVTQAAAVVELVEKPAPLVTAARTRDTGALAALLAKPHAGVNERSADGTTALHWAVYNNDIDLVGKLLAAGADVEAANDYHATPLSEAAVVGNPQVLHKLLDAGADVGAKNIDGQTALMVIARTSNVEAAKLLLKRGAKVNEHEEWRGQTPLMWAAAEGQPPMVKLLIEHGADVNARSRVVEWERQVTAEPRMQARPTGGFTPLLYAARRGCTECASLLIKAGADVNLTDPDGVTPLLLASLNFSFDTAALLVRHGADVDRWDIWGRSPLYAAVDMNTLPISGRADRPSLDKTSGTELIQILLEAGANPNLQLKLFPPYRSLRDDRGADGLLAVGSTPLVRAAKAGDLPAMKLLLAHGANVELPTVNGITPLMAATGNASASLDTRGRYKSEEQAIAATQMLLSAGANINARDRQGQTALYGAAGLGWNGVVEVLASKGIDLQAKDARGRMAIDQTRPSATSSGRGGSGAAHPDTEALLRKLMASNAGTPAGAAATGTP